MRDVLEMGARPDPGSSTCIPTFLLPWCRGPRRFEIAERVVADGSVRVALSDMEVERVVGQALDTMWTPSPVSLLFAYLMPDLERRIGAPWQGGLPRRFVFLVVGGPAGISRV